ncbi:MAG TPA: rhomboid family intramembrane serine protease [Solirubrobacteraceae bacterium]|jgi:membrane associated rhomboid family serine protease
MLPTRDNYPQRGFPLLTFLLVALGAALWLASLLHGGLLQLLPALACLLVFGQSVEDVLGRTRYAALCLFCGLVAFGLQALIGPRSGAATLAAVGVAAGVAGAYLALRPRGRILTLVLAPLFAGAVEIPALALIALWLCAQALIGAFAVDEPLAHIGAAWFMHLAVLPLAFAATLPMRRDAHDEPAEPSLRKPPRRLIA